MIAFLAPALLAITATAAPVGPTDIVQQAPAAAWVDIPAGDLLVMSLENGRRVVIQLAPDAAPVHVANIRRLAEAAWWDGTSVNRVQDNYVTQWGDATEKKPLPDAVVAAPPAEYERPANGVAFTPLNGRDAYAQQAGWSNGWPAAIEKGRVSLVHCYGMVGVGRGLAPDTGSGAELYAVNGHAPRHLDRNIALVGRVIKGMDALSSLPRGTEALGFYKTAEERMPITSIRLASSMPANQRPAFQVMRTDGAVFARYVDARANRRDAFFIRPAGAVDICNATVPVRPRP
jgi:peptidylprolyl isomerase